ncbi:PilE-like protein [Elusimicrobium minutum Pei191]|uniref:PilE-like protein n=1 Tax=Elusimicrobium minutum (strain Pei191) TaxID=445932 RepID=B2KEM5_ELUMP|nr:PilE-like protein [Elusimicrobium minutum Pei191]
MKKGFTLIELLVVVLIIGILAAIALPQYNKAVEKSRAAEAFIMVKAIKDARDRYFLATGKMPSTFDELDIDIPGAACSSPPHNPKDCKATKMYMYGLFDTAVSGYRVSVPGFEIAYYDNNSSFVNLRGHFVCGVGAGIENRDRYLSVCKSISGKSSPTFTNANGDHFVF